MRKILVVYVEKHRNSKIIEACAVNFESKFVDWI